VGVFAWAFRSSVRQPSPVAVYPRRQKVCTNDGSTLYPYGNAFEQKRCIDNGWMTSGSGSLAVTDFKEKAMSWRGATVR
jgi:hypothetical protein